VPDGPRNSRSFSPPAPKTTQRDFGRTVHRDTALRRTYAVFFENDADVGTRMLVMVDNCDARDFAPLKGYRVQRFCFGQAASVGGPTGVGLCGQSKKMEVAARAVHAPSKRDPSSR
jgi:hypothetical protein